MINIYRHKKIIGLLAGLIIVIGLALNVTQAWQNSPTADEPGHLASGVTQWREGNFDYNTPHPPLTKLIAAKLVLLQPDATVRFKNDAGKKFSDLDAANDFLYRSDTPAERGQLLTFLGRLPMILFWLAMVVVTAVWARKRWGNLAGLIAAGVLVFDPNLIGHGNLINTDVPIAAGFIATIWALDRYLSVTTRKNLIILVIIFALTQLTKFSAVILWPIVIGLGFIKVLYGRKVFSVKQWLGMTAALIGGTSFIIWAAYGFQFTKVDISSSWNRPTHYFKKLVDFPLPAGNYFQGLYEVIKHDKFGHNAFLLGETEAHGRLAYFPIAFATKTPIITLALFVLWVGVGLVPAFLGRGGQPNGWPGRSHKFLPPFSALVLGLPPIIVFISSLTADLNLGVRHIFPIWPFVALAIASLVTVSAKRWWRYTLVGGIIGLAITLGLAWPSTISYFNAFAGGTQNGYKVLQGSNLDWGQDAWRLRDFITKEKFTDYSIQLFGSVPEDVVWPDRQRLLVDSDIANGATPGGVVFVSSGVLEKPNSNVDWLKKYSPKWRIGSTITGYDFRK